MEYLREISRRHEALKKRIHSFRIPLSPAGQRFMGIVYFCIPIIGGYYIMQAAISQSKINLKDLKPATPGAEHKEDLAKLLNKYNPNKDDKSS